MTSAMATIFGRQRHSLNKLRRGSQEDAMNMILRLKANGFRQEFFMFLAPGPLLD